MTTTTTTPTSAGGVAVIRLVCSCVARTDCTNREKQTDENASRENRRKSQLEGRGCLHDSFTPSRVEMCVGTEAERLFLCLGSRPPLDSASAIMHAGKVVASELQPGEKQGECTRIDVVATVAQTGELANAARCCIQPAYRCPHFYWKCLRSQCNY